MIVGLGIMAKRAKRKKEPSVLRKMVDILWEDAKRRRALRLLERQSWGLDFLSAALARAGRGLGEGLVMVITDRNGVRMELRYEDARERAVEDSVFMRLDDDAFVERFIRENARR